MFLSIANASAVTLYVSDIQFVAIREGQNNNTRAVERGIKSGTPLEVLDQNDGYTRVRTPAGNEGWIADYFLSEDRVSRDQLINLQTQLTDLSETKIALQEELDKANNLVTALRSDVTTLATDKVNLESQIKEMEMITSQAQIIVENNSDNQFAIESLQQRLEFAQNTAANLSHSHEQKWFMIGAGTLFSGIFIGGIFSLFRRKKTNTGAWV